MVVGDVNSTVACALVTSKISFDANGRRPLIAHVEAGLRSFDSAMPEEINRIVTDHLSDLLFVTEESGIQNLYREGIAPEKVHFAGNTMIDSLLASKKRADQSGVLDQFGLRAGSQEEPKRVRTYALLTLHRPSNVDNRETLLSILEGLEELSKSCPILFSCHPRTRKRIAEFGLEHFFQPVMGTGRTGQSPVTAGIRLLDPLGYLDFLCLMKNAALVVTDSGGIQEETTCLMVPCVTVRENTERPVTVTCGTNTIAGTKTEDIRAAVREQLKGQKSSRIPEKWDGKAAARIVAGDCSRSPEENRFSTDVGRFMSSSKRSGGPAGMSLRSALGHVRRRLLSALYRRTVPLGDHGPVVSFTFDDFPRTAYSTGGAILEAHGARGTYYVTVGLMNASNELGELFVEDDLRPLMEKGHELGTQTFHHSSCRSVPLVQFPGRRSKGNESRGGVGRSQFHQLLLSLRPCHSPKQESFGAGAHEFKNHHPRPERTRC